MRGLNLHWLDGENRVTAAVVVEGLLRLILGGDIHHHLLRVEGARVEEVWSLR